MEVEAAAFGTDELLREVALQWLHAARRKRIDLGIQPEEAATPAVGDRHLLREAVANLVANAVAHAPESGTVTLFSGSDSKGWWPAVEDDGPMVAMRWTNSFRTSKFNLAFLWLIIRWVPLVTEA